MQIPISIS